MSYIHELDLDALKSAFKQIIEVDTELFSKKATIEHELDKLKQTHNGLIKENNKKIFIFCLDSFYFQYRILNQEMEDLSRLIIILNNRMYGEYYKLYNIIVSQLNERNIVLQSIVQHKKYPVYKDLEQLKEYSIEDISEIHDTILTIINELYVYYSSKQKTVSDYTHTSNINMTITNFIHTLEYENTLIREQLYLYVSYIEFFHSTQKRYLDKLAKRMTNFKKDVSENIINDANTSFIENLSNIKDVVRTPPSSPTGSVQSDLCSVENSEKNELVSDKSISQNTNLKNIVIATSNPDILDAAHNFGLDGIITIEGTYLDE
uniref:Uncharacterized protein n=1 Tax=viral metagenome TaxID=1070528 RepID=A0A6C0HH35_9ZZZZ